MMILSALLTNYMKKKTNIPLTDKEIKDIIDFYHSFEEEEVLHRLLKNKQHRTSNTYRHVCLVCEECMYYGIRRNIHYDYHSLIRGALLHDLFFYDWRVDKENRKGHAFEHPQRALDNAKKYYSLNPTEIDIIKCHMWPINFFQYPKTPEGRLVMWIDKKVTIQEVFARKKRTLFFDLDGTLLDTLDDLKEATNYALKTFGYPERTREEIKSFIGNGVSKLIERAIPNGLNNDNYDQCLEIFRQYYNEHCDVLTKPYPLMKKTLTTLKSKGYTLAVITNKVDAIAKKLIEKYYPNLFSFVQGDVPFLKKKPSKEMVEYVRKKMKVAKRKCIYIGDTDVDYLTSQNANIEVILVSYGYRDKKDLIKLDGTPIIIDYPQQLIDVIIGGNK